MLNPSLQTADSSPWKGSPYPKGPLRLGDAIFLPIPRRTFPTVPSFLEASRSRPPRDLLRLEGMDLQDVEEVHLLHPLWIPMTTYFIGDPTEIILPEETDFLGHTYLRRDTLEDPWDPRALWGLSALTERKTHRVRPLSKDCALIYTAHSIYRVPIPTGPRSEPAYEPGIFLTLSLPSWQEKESRNG